MTHIGRFLIMVLLSAVPFSCASFSGRDGNVPLVVFGVDATWPPMEDEPVAVAVRKGNSEALTLIYTGLERVRASGKMSMLEERWLIAVHVLIRSFDCVKRPGNQ